MASKLQVKVPKDASAADTLAFRLEHDSSYKVPKKIQEALDKLANSNFRWTYEAKFIQLAGVTAAQLKDYREQFKDYIAVEPQNDREKRVWAGTKEYAAELRELRR